MVEQGHENEQQQKTYHVRSFSEVDEILVKKDEMGRYNEEEKEPLMRVVKYIKYDSEIIPLNLRYIDRKKVIAATVNINKIVSLIKAEAIAETNVGITCCWQYCCWDSGLQKQGDDRK